VDLALSFWKNRQKFIKNRCILAINSEDVAEKS
jgi:hypothetical protein